MEGKGEGGEMVREAPGALRGHVGEGGKGEKGLKEERKGARGGGMKVKKRHRCEKGRGGEGWRSRKGGREREQSEGQALLR